MSMFIIRWKQRTATGLRWRYRTRDTDKAFWNWMNAASVVDPNDDWPWAYWSFSDPKDEDRLAELFGEPSYDPKEDDTLATAPPVPPLPASPLEEELFAILQEEIMKEVNREFIATIK